MKKKLLSLLLASICIFLFSCKDSAISMPDVSNTTVKNLEVFVLNVGRADCIIIREGTHTVLIDCGEDDDGDFIVSFLKSKGISFIDRLYITHFDKDHTGGSDTVLANIKCGGVYLPFYQKTSTQYVEMMNAIFTAGLEPQYVKQNDTFSLGNIQYNVFPPMDFSYQNDEDNEFSLIISAKYGEKSFLFTGDALNGRINESIKDLGEYDFIKMPNHGDYFKGLVDLISKTKPKFAAITCSIQEPAAKKTLNLLKNASAEVFLTSNGSICASCDGKLINVTLID